MDLLKALAASERAFAAIGELVGALKTVAGALDRHSAQLEAHRKAVALDIVTRPTEPGGGDRG